MANRWRRNRNRRLAGGSAENGAASENRGEALVEEAPPPRRPGETQTPAAGGAEGAQISGEGLSIPSGLAAGGDGSGEGGGTDLTPAALERLRQLSETPAPEREEEILGPGKDISDMPFWGGVRDYSDEYYRNKQLIFDTLVDNVDLTQLSDLDEATARSELKEVVTQIISVSNMILSATEQNLIFEDICSDVLGYGPLDYLLADDEISDIMVNGSKTVFVEVNGIIYRTRVRFRDDRQLMNICQRIVSQVGRRIDEASPICDARLPDGSRVNVIVPPLALDGPALTIRKFRREKLTLDDMRRFGTVSKEMADLLRIVGQVRCNILVTGGTGTGKTTVLNCLTGCIDHGERIVTCEDAAELQLQQPHVVRLETRPPNLEGLGEVSMRDLVRNCLRMRPERIVVGEVRGTEAFDLLQAMNTGHDGSMGTLHANNPREVLTRLESMITMGGFQLPARMIKEMISASIDVIVHLARLRDGTRRVTHITEVVGMDGETIILQDLFLYKVEGEDQRGGVSGYHVSANILRPVLYERARYYNLHNQLKTILESAPTEEDFEQRRESSRGSY